MSRTCSGLKSKGGHSWESLQGLESYTYIYIFFFTDQQTSITNGFSALQAVIKANFSLSTNDPMNCAISYHRHLLTRLSIAEVGFKHICSDKHCRLSCIYKEWE